ncbi:MAG: nucleotide exchange factor GrpE [Synergistaceae bacterium]|jgi:molecular chaperone GrpE (heat shock protein)|nr:nucleotide exchange factor GrpE [Synergistaceae bacterium]
MFGLGSMEKRISEKIEGFGEKIEAYLVNRIDGLDERLQQSVRQERRNQAALESLFENQKAELSMLRGIRNESKALNTLMAFAESFALWCQSQQNSPELRVLRAKLAALTDHFDLKILAENGVPFDPSLHEACAVRFDPNVPDGYVLETVRPGFLSGGEILRCASVVVNRPADVRKTWTENVTGEGGAFAEGEAGAE